MRTRDRVRQFHSLYHWQNQPVSGPKKKKEMEETGDVTTQRALEAAGRTRSFISTLFLLTLKDLPINTSLAISLLLGAPAHNLCFFVDQKIQLFCLIVHLLWILIFRNLTLFSQVGLSVYWFLMIFCSVTLFIAWFYPIFSAWSRKWIIE